MDPLAAAERLAHLRHLQELRQAANARRPSVESHGYEAWLRDLFPVLFSVDFAEHHHDLWRWVWAIEPGVRPDPFVALWARGGAKSTSAEGATVALGARRKRRYGLYCCATQDKADDHVANIGAMLESDAIAAHYPLLADRSVGKYGSSRGWRRNRLRTAAGFTIDAIGLDTASRGVKLEDARPDLLVIDDIDDDTDSQAAVDRKVRLLTRKILPAGANDLAVLAIQNLIHDKSVFAQLAKPATDGGAEFLANRIVSGPVPAVANLTYEQIDGRWTITGGEPTWEGQSLEVCQSQMDDWTLSAFLAEGQHEVTAPPGGMFDHLSFAHCRPDEVPDLVRAAVWVDPAVTDKDRSDCQAIQADGIGGDGRIFRLRSYEHRGSPRATLVKAITWAIELGADSIGVETDQGGDTWQDTYSEACREVMAQRAISHPGESIRLPRFKDDKAGAGHGPKTHRAAQMLADYERPNQIIHVLGYHDILEKALRRFPRTKPLDLVDASYWSWHDLRSNAARKPLRLSKGPLSTVAPSRVAIG